MSIIIMKLNLKNSINLSILDFKYVIFNVIVYFVVSINLSILDFKCALAAVGSRTVTAINLSILDFKSFKSSISNLSNAYKSIHIGF